MSSLRRSSAPLLGLSLVLALGAMGCGGNDDGPAGPTLDTTAPAVPSGVSTSMAQGSSPSVRVSWDANETDPDLAGYSVYRSRVEDGSYLPVAEGMLIQTNEWFDSGVQSGNSYFYRVAARDASSNESALSSPSGLTIAFPDEGGPSRSSN